MGYQTEAVNEIVNRIVNAVHPLRIILFGSAARGDAGFGSDVDLLVVMPEGTHRLDTMEFLHTRMLGVKVPVDMLVVTQSDLDQYADDPGLIYRTALREGRELYAA